MAWTAEIFKGNIVVLGDFNPAIVTPEWLEKNKLIGANDAKYAAAADNLIITRRGSLITTEAFLLQTRPDRLIVQSSEALSPVIRDIAAGILMLLAHTPVRAVGLNYDAHFKLPSKEDWHRFGDALAPKQVWYSLFPADKHNAGMNDLQIRIDDEPRETGKSTSHYRIVTAQPSSEVQHGAYISLNDHSSVASDDKTTAAEQAALVIQERWEAQWKEAASTFDKLLSAACASKPE